MCERKIPNNQKILETINQMPNDVFYSYFRMHIPTYEVRNVISLCERYYYYSIFQNYPVCSNLHVTVAYWASRRPIEEVSLYDNIEVSDRFNIGMSTCYRGFVQVLSAQKQIIAFPTTEHSNQVRVTGAFVSFRSHQSHIFWDVLMVYI